MAGKVQGPAGTERHSQLEVIWQPQRRQAAFIESLADDTGFGGARGGGKSDAVLGDFAVHEAKYGSAAIGLVLRRTRTELVELIARARQIYLPIGYQFRDRDSVFHGPKGGRLRFGYLESDSDADAYQGHSYTRLYFEEIGNFPSEAPVNRLQATLRSGHGVPCQMKSTCNPGGAGHQWVKARYRLDTHPKGMVPFSFEFPITTHPNTKRTVTKTRMFIPSLVTDNQYLKDDYIASLYMVGSPELVRCWLEGDWNVVEGAFFPEFSYVKHVVIPFAIPDDWLRFRSMDWGSAKPFSVGWWAVVTDDYRVGDKLIPRGSMVRYREWYGASRPNVGLKLTAEEVGREIKQLERNDPKISYGVLDPAAFTADGGPSIAERIAREGVWFNKADNKRTSREGRMGGWDSLRARLIGDGELPAIYFFNTCRDTLRTLPALQHDQAKPEDADSEQEDHAPDEVRYACMSRPFTRQAPSGQSFKDTYHLALVGGEGRKVAPVTLERLWQDYRPPSERRRI